MGAQLTSRSLDYGTSTLRGQSVLGPAARLADTLGTRQAGCPYTCSNRAVGCGARIGWCYPERCQNGHEWGPGLIIVSWVLCDCPAAQAASGGGAAGHLAVYCRVKGCRSVWYRPRHEPGT
jgi:hypothetical protein